VDSIAAFITATETAPKELSTIANIMSAPPMPFIPADLYGQLIILGFMAYAGAVEEGMKALAPFRAIAEPLADMVRPMRYPEIYFPEEPGYHPTAAGRTFFVDRIGHNEAETIVEYLQASDADADTAQGAGWCSARAGQCYRIRSPQGASWECCSFL
jgi:hypothetical protein